MSHHSHPPHTLNSTKRSAPLPPLPTMPNKPHPITSSPPSAPRPATNIWQLMGYPIPRGPCRHKPGILSTGCQCLRFMLNPVVAGSTFACDGCGHHASFHVLKGEYSPPEGSDPAGARVEMLANRVEEQNVDVSGGNRRKRVMELSEDEDGEGYGEWVEEDYGGELTIVKRGNGNVVNDVSKAANGSGSARKKAIPGAYVNENGGARSSVPAAKRSRV